MPLCAHVLNGQIQIHSLYTKIGTNIVSQYHSFLLLPFANLLSALALFHASLAFIISIAAKQKYIQIFLMICFVSSFPESSTGVFLNAIALVHFNLLTETFGFCKRDSNIKFCSKVAIFMITASGVPFKLFPEITPARPNQVFQATSSNIWGVWVVTNKQ